MKNKEKIYAITGIVLILDIIIKLQVLHYMEEYQLIKVIPNFFSIYYLKNTGAAFSILENSTVFLSILSVIFILLLNKIIIKNENSLKKMEVYSYGLVLGGIFGNLIDRIVNHGVIDYLSFRIFGYNFPVFNLADIAICVGIILLIITTIKEEIKEKNYKKEINKKEEKIIEVNKVEEKELKKEVKEEKKKINKSKNNKNSKSKTNKKKSIKRKK